MPKLGTITRVFLRNGHLIEMGATPAPIEGSIQPQYDGQIIGIFYVNGTDHEAEHYDVIAVPRAIFGAMMSMAKGVSPEQVYKNIAAEAEAALKKGGVKPSAIRRVYPIGESIVFFHESSLSMQEMFEHYQDRLYDAMTAYAEEEDDDDQDDAAQPADPQHVAGPVVMPNGAMQAGVTVATTGA